MLLTEKTLNSEIIYEGSILTLRRDTALLPNGKEALREVCHHSGGVGVLPLDADGNVIMVRQFRYPYGMALLEIPAGKMDKGAESHRDCGLRELQEETGYTAGDLVYLGAVYPSPGFLTEVLHLYLARELCPGETNLDEDEFLNVEKVPLARLCQMIMDDEVRDGKTIIAALKAKQYLGLSF